MGAGHKTAGCHYPSHHHVVTLIRFGFCGVYRFNGCCLGYLNESFGFNGILGFYRGFRLNKYVCLFLAA